MKSLDRYSLIQDLDLYYYWEPFHQAEPLAGSLKLSHLMLELRKKQKDFGKFPDSENDKIPSVVSPILFGFDTLNQGSAMGSLMAKLEGKSETISLHPQFRNLNIDERIWTQLALVHQREFLSAMIRYKGHDKRVFKGRWKKYFEMLGVYEYVLRMMRKSEALKLFIGANDHSGLSQYGFVAARKLGLESLYIQHASVSSKFPPLRMTYALLDGEDARQKYLAAGKTDTEIRLIGAMKYDPYLTRKEVEEPGRLVGVCFSRVAHDLHQNLELCQALEQEGVGFAVRFHPAVGKEVRLEFESRGWRVSEPEEENSLDFVLRCHSLVSGDSNILMESILLKRRPIYFSSDKQALDYYGFAKQGLVEKICLRWQEVIDLLGTEFNLEVHRRNAKHYHDPLYTEWEGRSTELAVRCIDELTGIGVNYNG